MEFFFPMLGLAAIAVFACVFWVVVTVTIGIVCRLRKKTWGTFLKSAGIWTAAYVLLIGMFYAGFAALVGTGIRSIGTASRSTLVGTYEVTYRDGGQYFGHEVLVLRSDGRYTQSYTTRSGKTFNNKGRWDTENLGDGTHVHLQDAYAPEYPPGKNYVVPAKQNGFLPVKNVLGILSLVINEDLGWAYHKISDNVP